MTRRYIQKMICLISTGYLPAMALFCGCGGGARDLYAPRIIESPAPKTEIIGYSVQGRPIQYYQFGQSGATTLFIASIHGNEQAGTPLLQQLIDHLYIRRRLWRNKTIAVVPVVNPDGCAANTRENARGVDLNRNFNAENRIDNTIFGYNALSEPESQTLAQIINRLRPAAVISLHQPLECIDYDGPGRELAEQMAAVCPLEIKKLGAQPGSMGAYVGEKLEIPIITMELPGRDSGLGAQELWQLYGQALLTAINFQP